VRQLRLIGNGNGGMNHVAAAVRFW